MVDMVAKAKALILGLLASAATTAATIDLTLPLGDYMLVPVQPYTVVTIQSTPVDPPVLDTDGDGVNDDIDQCPDTLLGDEVDATGCTVVIPPVDADGDGVLDDVDQCPTVPAQTADGCPAPQPPGSNPFADMSPGTWLEIPNSKLRNSPERASAAEFPWVAQGEGISGIMNDWCGGAFDTKRDRLMIGPCGGHNGYYGNEVYAFDMNDLQWHRLTDPQPVTGECPDPALYPCAIHTYDGLEYIPALDALVQVGGWGAPNTYALDLETNTWNVFSPSNQGRTGDTSAWDAENGLLWVRFSPYAGSGQLYSWNPSTDVWTSHGAYQPVIDYYTTATIDPVRALYVATGQHAGKVYTWPLDPSMSGVYATARTTTGATAITSSKNPGLEYHAPSGLIVGWDGGQSVYTLDLESNVWTEHQATGDDPGPADANGTYGRFRYVPSMGVFVVVNSVDSNVFVYKPDFGPVQSPPITSFELQSPVDGEQPYTIGIGFKKGDVIAPAVNGAQVIVKRRWNDGSAKHAIVSGAALMPAVLSVYEGGGSSGPPMTAADIETANPRASVQLGNLGSIDLADLLHEPFRTWIRGPEMVEAHYRGAVETGLVVWFHVRLYKSGQAWVRVSIENGTLDVPSETVTYSASVTIDDNEVFSDQALTHYAHTRWTAEGWIGSDPRVTPKHDTRYLMASGLVPNYWKRNPSGATLEALYREYAPNERGGWTGAMGLAGFQAQIGILPQWDALYVATADSRAYESVMANAKALNNFGIIWTDSETGLPIMLSERGQWTSCGYNKGGGCYAKAGELSWEWAHHGSGGFLAYLLTGDYFHFETMAHQAARVYLYYSVAHGVGTSRKLVGGPRGSAWALRTTGQLAGIGPDDDALVNEYKELVSNNIDSWLDDQNMDGVGPISYRQLADANGIMPNGRASPWLQHFWMQAGGYVRDLEPLKSMKNFDAWLEKFYRSVIDILGGSGVDQYCYTRASEYTIKISNVNIPDPRLLFDSWGKVYEATFGMPNIECGDDLQGSSAGHPRYAATGYWGNLLPAIAYAVDDEAPGAADAWQRLTSATNWPVVESSGFDNIPNWGIVPRTIER